MITNELQSLIKNCDASKLASIVEILLKPHLFPVFGASKLIEHEVAALEALKQLGWIETQSDEYNLVKKLRITKPKARSLIYQSALRSNRTEADWNAEIQKILTSPTIYLHEQLVYIEVYDPFIMDVLRSKIRELGYLSDGSFSGSVARIPVEAMIALVKSFIPGDNLKEVENKLRARGIVASDLEGLVMGFLKKAGESFASEAGGKVGQKIGEGVSSILKMGINYIGDLAGS